MSEGRRSETYYDILKLRRNCNDKEIRDAFIKLSKQFHPDVKGPNSKHADSAEFIKISEAYRTLSKPNLRRNYDNCLMAAVHSRNNDNTFQNAMYRPWEIKPNYNANPGPYYGIKGLNKISNAKIAIALLIFGLLGGLTGMGLVKHSFTTTRNKLDKISEKANAHHSAIREEAQRFGREEQLIRVANRIKSNERKKN